MSSPVFTCSICKKPMKKEESRPINDVKGKVMGQTCQASRNTTIHLRCSASKCTTPLYKLKYLKPLPKSVDGLTPQAKKTFLENEFGSVALVSSLWCVLCKVTQTVIQRKQKCSAAPICKQFCSKSSWSPLSII